MINDAGKYRVKGEEEILRVGANLAFRRTGRTGRRSNMSAIDLRLNGSHNTMHAIQQSPTHERSEDIKWLMSPRTPTRLLQILLSWTHDLKTGNGSIRSPV
jgi:hypothetical protein